MCCDICPFYDECAELDELQENCCRECPDFGDCQSESRDADAEEDSPAENEAG